MAILIRQDITFNQLDSSEFDEKLRTGAKRLLHGAKRPIITGAKRLTWRVEMF